MFTEYLRAVEPSQTLLLNEQSRLLESSGREIFKFGFGQSPFPPLPAAVQALKDAASHKAYSPVQGLPQLREKVAHFHRDAEGIDTHPDRVLIAPGSKSLLFTVMAAYTTADVFIPAPAWVSYMPQAKMLGHAAVKVPTTYAKRWRVTPEALEAALRSRPNPKAPGILILNHPGNPEGLSYTPSQLEALASICRAHKLLVLSDEIYGLLNHDGKHTPLAPFYPEGTITTGGLSKWCGAGGWRLGIALLPEALDGAFKEVLLGIASETYSCAPAPVQEAACHAYHWNAQVQDYLAHQRKLLKHIGNWSAQQLQQSGVHVCPPEGGFYLFLDFAPVAEAMQAAGITTSQALCSKLLQDTGVALLPGHVFGMEPEQLSARLAYVEFDGEVALKRSRELGLDHAYGAAFHDEVFGKTIRGIDALCEWVAAFTRASANAA